MKQVVLSNRPTKEELILALKEGLGQDYHVRFFGFGLFKSIILSQSPLNAIQISYTQPNSIQIEGTFSSPFSALMVWLDAFLGAGLSNFCVTPTDWRQMEAEVSAFLEYKFGKKS